jgi:multidrug resistance efflux pump
LLRSVTQGKRVASWGKTIIAAQIDQVEAMLTQVNDKLARATLVAPFDGVVVSGDKSEPQNEGLAP